MIEFEPLPALSTEELGTLSIEELQSKRFQIPSYQRGYRWTDVQVQQLLDDVAEFEPAGEAFYCLQPIVVRAKGNGCWEVIDGQQRLTTIWLIQRLFDDKLVPYSLDFDNDSRQTISKQTLEDAVSQAEPAGGQVAALQTLEASYIYGATATIRDWMNEKKEKSAEYLAGFSNKLLKHTRVIWYQTPVTDGKAQSIFTRLNAGKIPLTNAELIKALLLKRPITKGAEMAYAPWQFELAASWDNMETALGQANFWGWLGQHNDPERPPRLEWLLRLVEDRHEKMADARPLALFQAVEKRLKGKLPTDNWQYWQEVEKVFQRLRSWYDDPDLYHRVGYLVAVADPSPLKELLTLAESDTKTAFLAQLGQRIAEHASLTSDNATQQWDQLQYGKSNNKLKHILLLHNVVTTWQARNMGGRFPFEKYLREKKWSLEHIHPQNPQAESESASTYQEWLDDWQEELEQWSGSRQEKENADLLLRVQDARQLLKTAPEDDELPGKMLDLRTKYLALFSDLAAFSPSGDGHDPLHALENMALLGGGVNSALSNSVFPEKRAKLLRLHQASSGFVPPATLQIFLKTHTPHPDDLRRWTQTDRQHYRAAIEQSIQHFLTPFTHS